MGFQSRLTRGWIEPFSDVILVDLAKAGTKRLAVFCPAFVADCLETLEENRHSGQRGLPGRGRRGPHLDPLAQRDAALGRTPSPTSSENGTEASWATSTTPCSARISRPDRPCLC